MNRCCQIFACLPNANKNPIQHIYHEPIFFNFYCRAGQHSQRKISLTRSHSGRSFSATFVSAKANSARAWRGFENACCAAPGELESRRVCTCAAADVTIRASLSSGKMQRDFVGAAQGLFAKLANDRELAAAPHLTTCIPIIVFFLAIRMSSFSFMRNAGVSSLALLFPFFEATVAGQLANTLGWTPCSYLRERDAACDGVAQCKSRDANGISCGRIYCGIV